MALTWTDLYTKGQRLAKDSNSDTLIQLKQDINTGYHMFNQKLARYYSRKQQFANLVANQQIYQTPIDSVRVIALSILVSSTYEVPVKEIRSEYQWRQLNSYKTFKSNWPSYYHVLGNDGIAVWPIPSQSLTNGLRFVYQPQDHDLSIDTVANTSSATVSLTNGSTTATASSGILTTSQIGLSFHPTGVVDTSWYDIVAVPTTSTLTLKSPYVGSTASGLSWEIGQLSIIPQEYQDAPMHYALGLFFSAQGNESRSQFHLGTEDKPGMFYSLVKQCKQDYSSSTQSSVITDEEEYLNLWTVPPIPGAVHD